MAELRFQFKSLWLQDVIYLAIYLSKWVVVYKGLLSIFLLKTFQKYLKNYRDT